MAKATWDPVANASPASFSRNQTLTDLQDAAVSYDDPTVGYDDVAVYYNGYDPTGTAPEGEAGAVWTRETE